MRLQCRQEPECDDQLVIRGYEKAASLRERRVEFARAASNGSRESFVGDANLSTYQRRRV